MSKSNFLPELSPSIFLKPCIFFSSSIQIHYKFGVYQPSRPKRTYKKMRCQIFFILYLIFEITASLIQFIFCYLRVNNQEIFSVFSLFCKNDKGSFFKLYKINIFFWIFTPKHLNFTHAWKKWAIFIQNRCF